MFGVVEQRYSICEEGQNEHPLTMTMRRIESLGTKCISKVLSTDDTCYLIYRRTQVTTLGTSSNRMREYSKYRKDYLPGNAHGQLLGNVRETTNNRSCTILAERS